MTADEIKHYQRLCLNKWCNTINDFVGACFHCGHVEPKGHFVLIITPEGTHRVQRT